MDWRLLLLLYLTKDAGDMAMQYEINQWNKELKAKGEI